ncbi:hypothetical protein [Corynebacterium glutamicum]|uniref:hypothetical protein n=1 Tax=Corynebacterium glutamicum TaxID=1718 RepID=UPI001177BF4B|nr:hypothetical protein [Corynebacterium glutamicum]
MPSGSMINRRIPKKVQRIPTEKKSNDTHQGAKDAPAATTKAHTKETDNSINIAIKSPDEFSGMIIQKARNTTRYITKRIIVETNTLLSTLFLL